MIKLKAHKHKPTQTELAFDDQALFEIMRHYSALSLQPEFMLAKKKYISQPFSSHVNLKQDISTINWGDDEFETVFTKGGPESHVVEIHELLFTLEFVDNTLVWTDFADQSALTNGIDVSYQFGNVICLLETIKDNADLLHQLEAPNKFSDGAQTKNNILTGVNDLESYSRNGIVLDLERGDKMIFDVKNNLSGFTNLTDFDVTVRGAYFIQYKAIDRT